MTAVPISELAFARFPGGIIEPRITPGSPLIRTVIQIFPHGTGIYQGLGRGEVFRAGSAKIIKRLSYGTVAEGIITTSKIIEADGLAIGFDGFTNYGDANGRTGEGRHDGLTGKPFP